MLTHYAIRLKNEETGRYMLQSIQAALTPLDALSVYLGIRDDRFFQITSTTGDPEFILWKGKTSNWRVCAPKEVA